MEDSSTPDSARGTRSRKEALREYFAIHEDAVFTKKELGEWLQNLGLVTNKEDVHGTAMGLAEYMVEVKGYTTGEDMLQVEAGDIEEARTNGSLKLTDVSVSMIVRYMRGTAEWV